MRLSYKPAIELSLAERNVLTALDYGWVIPHVEAGSIVAPKAFEMAAMEAFCKDQKGPAVNAIRRMVIAMREGKIYRQTPEWEALCMMEERT